MSETPVAEVEQKEQEIKGEKATGKIAVILVRGLVGITQGVKDTLRMLNLHSKNQCVVVDNTSVTMGMIRKVKDYVTWGEISDATFTELVTKRGKEHKGRTQDRKKLYSYKTLSANGKQYQRSFNLNPPRKGFGRKGIKVSFKVGGGLGYRGEKMNDLIARML